MIKYSIVIPVFNEEEVLPETYKRLTSVMSSLNSEYELIFIDDGSIDNSSIKIKEFYKSDKSVKLLELSRNFGHQIAISAGIEYASGNAIIIIDADLQDPPELIPQMIEKWEEGYEVVYGKRIGRKGESFLKKVTAFIFYRLFQKLTNSDVPLDTGDFRLIDKKVGNVIKKMSEKSRYMRGLFFWTGFKQTHLEYVREERHAGSSKYSLSKMFDFAVDAIFSFSYLPLKMATLLGFNMSLISFLYLLFVIYEKYIVKDTVIGWASVIAVNLFFNGIMLIILGIIGEYTGRIYEETKCRPLYVLREKTGFS